MNIFLSYAAEDVRQAERIDRALREEGHAVFFDRAELPAGAAFHQKIREHIRAADVLVFLVSPRSVEPGTYSLTELELAKAKWRRAPGRVLPVVIEPTSMESVPALLSPTTILEPAGDPVAETVAAVAGWNARFRSRRMRAAALLGVVALALALWVFPWGGSNGDGWKVPHPDSDTYRALSAALQLAGWEPHPEEFLTRAMSDAEHEYVWQHGDDRSTFRVLRSAGGLSSITGDIPEPPTAGPAQSVGANTAVEKVPGKATDKTAAAVSEELPAEPAPEEESSDWPETVTLVRLEDGFSIRGDLGDGVPLEHLRWASNSSVACWPGTENVNFQGNHVFFALEHPQSAYSLVSFTVAPDSGVDVSVYAYQTGTEMFAVPPDVSRVVSCEAALDYQNDSNPGEPEHTRALFASRNPYNVFIGVAGAAGHESGGFRLTLHLERR